MQRTEKQNSSLHLWFREVAWMLNEGGYSFTTFMERLVKAGIDTPFTEENVKEYYFKLLAKAMFQKESTTELTTGEMSEVLKFSVRSPWSQTASICLMYCSSVRGLL